MQQMREIGNKKSNLYYLAKFTGTIPTERMAQHIADKYDRKLWVINST